MRPRSPGAPAVRACTVAPLHFPPTRHTLSSVMGQSLDALSPRVAELEKDVQKLRAGPAAASVAPAIERWASDARALLFHLHRLPDHPPLLAVLGGTGTGKSTVVNRLVEAELSATSFRRTFTSGAVAIARQESDVPQDWLALPNRIAAPADVPARGAAGELLILRHDHPLIQAITLIDTADLDGDQPLHHAEADRVFRWAEAVLFLVTPEKYQMTELLPYYRLARRYGLPALFVMNKCEESAVLEDYRRQLADRAWPDARLFSIPRDDAGYEPSADANLPTLRSAAADLPRIMGEPAFVEKRQHALGLRCRDLAQRLRDKVIAPLKDRRREIDRLLAAMRAMTTPSSGVDVSPVTRQLQRRLQEQSVLYLMGPQRFLQRVRQVPGLLLRLPRTAWDLLMHGQAPQLEGPAAANSANAAPPDFPALLADQFRVLQSRLDDILLSSPLGLASSGPSNSAEAKIDPNEAADIARQELADLKRWLEERWDKAPRDTAVLHKLLKYLPGGKHLTRWSEAAPYLLAVIVAVHGAFFGPVDLAILGSYGLAAWLGERLSNEVSARTRQANRRIGDRFARLAGRQIEQVCAWLDRQAPRPQQLERLENRCDSLAESLPRDDGTLEPPGVELNASS